MSQVKVYAARARLSHVVVHFPVVVDYGELARKHVRVNVAGTQVLQNKVFVGSFGRTRPEIYHDGHFTQFAGFHGLVHRFPRRVIGIKGFACPVVGGFDADHYFVVRGSSFGSALCVKVGDDLL